MSRTRRLLLPALGGLLLLGLAAWAAGAEPELAGPRARQKEVQAETDRLVRRVQTMIRALEYNRLDRTAEKQLFDQVAGTLSGLSHEQMARVVAALEKAGAARGEARTAQLREAQKRHEEIVLGLKGLLAKFDAVKSLEQAADRLDKMARDELDIHLQIAQLVQDVQPPFDGRQLPGQLLRVDRLAGEQGFVRRDVGDLLEQLAGLGEQLPPEQAVRLHKAEQVARAGNLLANLEQAGRQLRARGRIQDRPAQWRQAADLQCNASGALRDLARILRGSTDRLDVLREARRRVEKALDDQTALHDQAKSPAKPEAQGGVEDPVAERARALSAQQAAIEFDTADARRLLQPHAADLANKLAPAATEMRRAGQALRNKQTPTALEPQQRAARALREVKEELDRRITRAEKEKADPLANLTDARATVEEIIKEQQEVRDRAAEADKAKQAERLADLAPRQQDLARRTDEVRKQPPAAKPEAREALEKAARAMEQGTRTLREKKGGDSVAKQDEALRSLEKAKKALGEEIAEVEKRRQEIAALEKADEKLGELIDKETKVAQEVRDQAKRPQAEGKDLAKRQGDITPPARELGKELQKSDPEAARRVEEGARQMDAAKGSLDEKKLSPGARKADAAVQKLKEARKAVARALDERRGKEAAEQAAARPRSVDTDNAAQQIAKSLEQAEKAAEQSRQAADRLGQKPGVDRPDLAALQKEVAKRAGEMELPRAAGPADEAAESLTKGDLPGAVGQQKKALAQLQDAARTRGEAVAGKAPATPAGAKNAGELTPAQEELLRATEALMKSQAANQAALTALGQARAQAPQVVRPQLAKAGRQLAKAGRQLPRGAALPAHVAQGDAIDQLRRALGALDSALAQAGRQGGGPEPQQPQQPQHGQNPGQGRDPSQGQLPGQGQGQARQPGQGPERNEGRGTGSRLVGGPGRKVPSRMGAVGGDGVFIHLPPRQREMIKQALSEALPPEYAALIQQYYINIARGQPPATPPARKKR